MPVNRCWEQNYITMKHIILKITGILAGALLMFSCQTSQVKSERAALKPGGVSKHYKAVLDKKQPESYGKKQNAEVYHREAGMEQHYIKTIGYPYPPDMGNKAPQ